MANTSEKMYIAMDSTAQEILNNLNNVAKTSDLNTISNAINKGISGNFPYGYKISSVTSDTIGSGKTVTVTGKGCIMIESGAGDCQLTIDGVSFYVWGAYDSYRVYINYFFNNSLVIKGNSSYINRYAILME